MNIVTHTNAYGPPSPSKRMLNMYKGSPIASTHPTHPHTHTHTQTEREREIDREREREKLRPSPHARTNNDTYNSQPPSPLHTRTNKSGITSAPLPYPTHFTHTYKQTNKQTNKQSNSHLPSCFRDRTVVYAEGCETLRPPCSSSSQ